MSWMLNSIPFLSVCCYNSMLFVNGRNCKDKSQC